MTQPPLGDQPPFRTSPVLVPALAGPMALVTTAALAFPEWFDRPSLWAWGCGSALLLMGVYWAASASASHTLSEDNSP